MKRMMIIVACEVVAVVVAGCIPGEATIKLSAENVRRVLKGEVVEVPVHGEVEFNERKRKCRDMEVRFGAGEVSED